MKHFLLSMLLVAFGQSTYGHGAGESRISVEAENQGSYNAGVFQYAFQLFDDQAQKALSDKDLMVSITKILHLIAYDPSRNEFNHVHPSFDGKVWTVELNLPTNGNYFVWAQGQLLDGTEFSAVAKTQVVNGKPEIPAVPLPDIRKASNNGTTLELTNVKLQAGKMAMINYKVTRDDGQEPIVTPYLGAPAHVIAVSPDGDELIHVHPVVGPKPNTGMIHAIFPNEGDYRVWVQLLDHDVLKTIPLSVNVSK